MELTRLEEIKRGIAALFSNDSLVELRIPKYSAGTIVGYFYDKDKLAEAIESYSGKVQAVYYTLNEPSVEAYEGSAAKDKAVVGANATGDGQITRRNWLLVDCDPTRVDDKGNPLPSQTVSSTNAEKEKALAKAQEIFAYLFECGWPTPVTADSGNGYHLLYNLGSIDSTPELTVTVQTILKHLAEKFNDAFVKVDTTVFNPSRITKAYGSLAGKGEATTERPHRYSAIRKVPEKISAVPLENLQSLKIQPAQKKSSITIKGHTPSKIASADVTEPEKMEEFLEYYEIDHKIMKREKNGYSWAIVPCPFNDQHNLGEVGVSLGDDGKMGFKCFHNSCIDNHWTEFKSFLETKTGKKFFFKTNVAAAAQPSAAPTSSLVMKRASAITPEVLTWLWPNRIPFGKLTLFAGHPGIGKGMATMYIAAMASQGTGWHDQPNTNAPCEVLIISSEDSASDTLVPRLMAAGADMDKVSIVEGMKSDKGEKAFGLDADLPALRKALESNPGIKLIIIDPIMNHLGALKGNNEQELRAGITPLGLLAAKHGCAVVLVTHFNKSIANEGIQRVGGAMGMVGAVRVAWTFTEDKEDGLRKMLPLKANIAPDTGGLQYEIVSHDVEINGQTIPVGRIKFGGVTHSSVESSLKNDAKNGPKAKIAEAQEWLQEFLADGEVKLVNEVQLSANTLGINKATLHAAAVKIGCKKMGGPTQNDPEGLIPETWQLVKVD